jgi:predicted RNase H-like HicB family nuclease
MLTIERAEDGRWIDEIAKLTGVIASGSSAEEARNQAAALALRVIADRGQRPVYCSVSAWPATKA